MEKQTHAQESIPARRMGREWQAKAIEKIPGRGLLSSCIKKTGEGGALTGTPDRGG